VDIDSLHGELNVGTYTFEVVKEVIQFFYIIILDHKPAEKIEPEERLVH
jgi:hypothetical protein